MTQGIIFDIEEFAIHDGPGIRKTVFLKGCPLRCAWCHNPEGMAFGPQLLVSPNGCTHCGACRAVCPHPDQCGACGACIATCPHRLRRICGKAVTPEDLAAELQKDLDFLTKMGGGITFSGGEPLAQPDFLLEIIPLLRPFHIAVETSGFAPQDIFRQITGGIDLTIMDIKHTDPEMHRKFTGVDNRLILENLQQLCSGNRDFIIRIPVIPGVNDTRENFENTAKLIHRAKALERLELLPYHKTAGAKYVMAGKVYQPPFDPSQSPCLGSDVFQQYGIRSVVL